MMNKQQKIEKRYNHKDYILFYSKNKGAYYYYTKKQYCIKYINLTDKEKKTLNIINAYIKERVNNFTEYKKEIKNNLLYIDHDIKIVEKKPKSQQFIELINKD